MPNCVSEYAKHDKNMPIFLEQQNNWKIGSKCFHPVIKFTAQSTIDTNAFKAVCGKEYFPSKESDTYTRMLQSINFAY